MYTPFYTKKHTLSVEQIVKLLLIILLVKSPYCHYCVLTCTQARNLQSEGHQIAKFIIYPEPFVEFNMT